MHKAVLDYPLFLSLDWCKWHRGAKSEIERERVLMEVWEHVAPSEEQDRETEV